MNKKNKKLMTPTLSLSYFLKGLLHKAILTLEALAISPHNVENLHFGTIQLLRQPPTSVRVPFDFQLRFVITMN
jgi:hypothetical protein